MKRKRVMAAVAVASALAVGLTACGGGSGSSSTSGGGGAAFNAAIGKVFNPSETKGGTLRFANSGDWDSLDPADMYYGYEWNFARLTGRGLVMFASAPGQEGTKLVPDLAQSLGQSSDGGKTWTYKLRSGVKFEDGTKVTSKDVKYAVERSLDKTVFPDGPTYFNDFLDLQGYTTPYSDPSPDKLGLKAIETPDDSTIVFHLKTAFSGFDYFAALPSTQPVPVAADKGADYKKHVVSTGPYKFSENNLSKNFTLVRNDQWDQSTDPNRKPLPDQITVQLNVNADDIDSRLQAGDLDIDIAGTGVQAAAQGKILGNPAQKQNADNPVSDRLWYAGINGDVAPLDNVHCRNAIEYAADKTSYQAAYGGPTSGGDIATHLLPPPTQGSENFDPFPSPNHAGDADKAKQELQACGQPNGFSTNISYRAERPKEKNAAEALQQSLGKVGIKLTIKPYPTSDYFKLYAGKPDYAKANGLGIMLTGWQGDWTDGFGFLKQIVDSRVIHASGGNTNLTVKDPAVDALVDKATTTSDTDARNKAWVDVDKKVMSDAYILPGIFAKGLLYRPANLTNVFVNDAFGMYDYLALGVKK
ncbi:ABC transporter substrate-binding protein [Kutzneria buriramensis]|uniref:Peptide/nickel transport system substrate-binding protein n=1 Tax=Kutzneria buriramensis TaxID=1045776 RepID=A0A3E0HAF4_9PSEU|nr:ABC transporter substrate-binding protein [Kutzneria buriramensis]REH41013.1 peptide/nickel transport system substrate-binding protein [Kutzneria buriramensis]